MLPPLPTTPNGQLGAKNPVEGLDSAEDGRATEWEEPASPKGCAGQSPFPTPPPTQRGRDRDAAPEISELVVIAISLP